ncbi:MAG TPA: aminotransferase class I/II-fold pyridoxal phosphate-dependent enzyme [Firmicutes bacterium]|nr:aminotransferase class I/II-fold pyridoxal phosphate-dependent enzyme [Bacillota bacterium]
MQALKDWPKEQLSARAAELRARYEQAKAMGLKLDMSRGKPGPEQLDLTLGLLDCVNARDGYTTDSGVDTRNYGLLDGIPEAKKLFAEILEVEPSQVIVGGNSSLNLMFDYIAMAYSHGVNGGKPWCREETVKFLCPSPGYDRHFGVTEYFGFELIAVDMTPDGPDMDVVETYAKDPAVKGIWCVPMYSNPDGITYSDETVRRLAAMETAAPDFRIMWDNAYCLHHLTDTPDTLLNLYSEAEKCGTQDRVVIFASTSKVSFPGSGIAAMAGSPATVADVKKRMNFQTIGYDKLNMLRHVRYFKNADGIREHMKLHAAILRPKFQVVLDTLKANLEGKGIAEWNSPRGGYFVSVNLMDGCAKKTVRLLKEAGVVMTGAGATYPYGKDPRDRNLRIAPTFPPLNELKTAIELFCVCAELAAIEQLLAG